MRITACLCRAITLLPAALLPVCLPHAAAQQANSKSQVIYLPDPTPRETDPHLKYGDDTAAQARARQNAEMRNAKRIELVQWAANQLVVLSQRLQADVAVHKPGESLTQATANAGKIEQLAANLKAAVKAP